MNDNCVHKLQLVFGLHMKTPARLCSTRVKQCPEAPNNTKRVPTLIHKYEDICYGKLQLRTTRFF